jgi:hypothetical protein
MYEWFIVYLFGTYEMRLTIIPCFASLGVNVISCIFEIFGVKSIHRIAAIILICALPSILAMYLFWNPFKCVPGATDNLTGCYTSISIMKQLSQSGTKL